MKRDKTQKLWSKAKKIIPGGNMMLSKKPDLFLPEKWPAYFSKTKGCKVWDLDGREYLDLSIMGVGTNILGYNNIEVDEAVKKTIRKGNMSTLNCPEEVYLTEKLLRMHPWADMAKFTRSGGEANAVAVRIARAAAKNVNIAVCGYHGWHDWYLAANIGNNSNLNKHLLKGLNTLGVPKQLKKTVFPFNYNNLDELEKIIKTKKIGIIKMEVSRNFEPNNNFLKKVRDIANKRKIILIFDECTSGFRQTFGGLHKYYKVEPDLAIFGKAMGNGYAINAVIGKKKVMKFASQTFISSTFWTERIGPTAALKTLEVMKRIKSWETITSKGKIILKEWKKLSKKYNLQIVYSGIPALARFEIKSKNFIKYKTLITQEFLKENILASNMIYFSVEHSNKVLKMYLEILDKVFKKIEECENGRKIEDFLSNKVSFNSFERVN